VCHTQAGGPEACVTCHGNFGGSVSELANWAPPEDLSGNASVTDRGVGAHQGHLTGTNLSEAFVKDCNLCHPDIQNFDDPRHIDVDPAIDMDFNAVATDSGRVTPTWPVAPTSCANTYCHGNFTFLKSESKYTFGYATGATEITGNKATVDWTSSGGGNAACGTCHGLPPEGHLAATITACATCHAAVVDGSGNIIDKTKHINQKIDVLGDSYRP
ncbi:MAG: hypothetical protein E4H13_10720, partial [Calditrichales bacterium]